jgi:uncharacterized membrane protein required for colicin V production
MNILDIIIIVLILIFGIAGFKEGLVRGVIKLIGFVITIILIAVFADPLGKLADSIPFVPHKAAVILVFLSFFILGSIFFSIIGNIVKKAVHLTPLGFFDSILGITIGVIKALFLGGVLAVILSLMPADSFLNKQYTSSLSGAPLTRLISHTIPVITSGGIKLFKYFSPRPHQPQTEKQHYANLNSL